MPVNGILHCDMNAFYASVEQALHPEWQGRALAVCGSPKERQGIVLAKSEEAKQCGVQTGEVIWKAQQKCPQLLVVPPHYQAYLYYSKEAQKIYQRYTDQVEPFGLDECWLDVRQSHKLFGSGLDIANELREVIKRELGLSISVGVSFNKIFAKLASDLKKPDATTLIPKEGFAEHVEELPVGALLGVGPATEGKLRHYGIYTIGALAKRPAAFLQQRFGKNGLKLWRYANGLDNGQVQRYGSWQPVKSIGHGSTCREDLVNAEEVAHLFLILAQTVARRLDEEACKAGGIQIELRNRLLQTEAFQVQLPYPSQSSLYLARAAQQLFVTRYQMREPIRSLTLRAIQLVPEAQPLQMNFFSDAKELERLEKLESCMRALRKRFGPESIQFARLCTPSKRGQLLPDDFKPPGLPLP